MLDGVTPFRHTVAMIIEAYSVLENGIIVPGVRLAVGSFFNTQWGLLRVVSNGTRTLNTARTEPYGV